MFKFAGNKLSVPEIWQASFALYKQTFSKVWYLALLLVLVISIFDFFPIKPNQPPNLLFMAVTVVIVFVSLFLSALILHRINNLASAPNYLLSDSIVYTLSKYLILIVSMLAIYIILFIAYAILVALLTPLWGQFGQLLFGLFAIFIGISLMFNLPFILFDHKGWYSALASSCKIVSGNWWRTFAVFLVPGLLFSILQMLIQIITKNIWVNSLITGLIMLFFFPFLQAIVLVQFNDLKLRAKSAL